MLISDDGAYELRAVVNDDGYILDVSGAPLTTGCPACDERPQPGHIYCNDTPESLRALEHDGQIGRTLVDSSWVWYYVDWRSKSERHRRNREHARQTFRAFGIGER